jgi:hypothetical protein
MLALATGAVFISSAAQASVIPLPNLVPVSVPSGTPYSNTNGQPAPFTQFYSPTIVAGSATDDPNLPTYCTYDIQVVVSSASGSDRWASGDLRAQLGAGGMFYIPPGAFGTDSNYLQLPATRDAVGSRFLEADTMVMSPLSNATRGGILGKSKFSPASQVGAVFPSNGSNFLDANGTAFEPANDMTLVDVAWGDAQAVSQALGSNGTFTIARLTVKAGSTGTFVGRVGSTLDPSNPVTFSYVLGVVPEPTSMALLGLGLGAVALRRRK